MDPNSPWIALLPIGAGVCFSLIAFAYRLGQDRGVLPVHIMLGMGLAGTAFFAVRTASLPWGEVPGTVFALGAVGGAGQYLVARLIRPALRMGPLSPLWCVMGLAFLPVVAYTRLFRSQSLSGYHVAALLAAVGCVVIASGNAGDGTAAADPSRPRGSKMLYGLLLGAILLLNGVLSVAQKELGFHRLADGRNYAQHYGEFFLLSVYAAMGILPLADLALSRRLGKPRWGTLALVGMAAFGSVCGLSLLNACMHLSAVVFAVAGVVSLLVVAVVSVAAMGERPTAVWFATVALGVAAVVLANLDRL